MGLVNRVVPHEDLLTHVREIATEIATWASPRSVRIMKRQLFEDQSLDIGTSIRRADHEMVACFATPDFREGVASFLQRRTPKW